MLRRTLIEVEVHPVMLAGKTEDYLKMLYENFWRGCEECIEPLAGTIVSVREKEEA